MRRAGADGGAAERHESTLVRETARLKRKDCIRRSGLTIYDRELALWVKAGKATYRNIESESLDCPMSGCDERRVTAEHIFGHAELRDAAGSGCE